MTMADRPTFHPIKPDELVCQIEPNSTDFPVIGWAFMDGDILPCLLMYGKAVSVHQYHSISPTIAL